MAKRGSVRLERRGLKERWHSESKMATDFIQRGRENTDEENGRTKRHFLTFTVAAHAYDDNKVIQRASQAGQLLLP